MEKVLQFGEGGFLRAFVDWMIEEINEKCDYNGEVVIVQPIPQGMCDLINEQNGKYTLIARGIENGEVVEERKTINCVSRCINPYADFNAYLECAKNPDLRVIVSNTTEAGIAYNPDDKVTDAPPASYPGKLTVFLYERFKAFNGDMSKGFIIIPCELIEKNGENLKTIVLRLAKEWELGDEFINWIEKANEFTSTLVDRIVTGYPKAEADEIRKQIGWNDNLIDTCEIFHFWVIQGDKKLAEELPFTKAGLNVIWTDDQTPYRTRKVRILNGAHTMTALAAYLGGLDTVGECIENETVNDYIRKGIFEEIIPTLDLPKEELDFFANAVLERFANPFIRHELLSISLNSVSKFKARDLPSLLEYKVRKGELPNRLTFALAALIAFYKGDLFGRVYEVKDDADILADFKAFWAECDTNNADSVKSLVSKVLAKDKWWGEDLNNVCGLLDKTADYLNSILKDGIIEVMKTL